MFVNYYVSGYVWNNWYADIFTHGMFQTLPTYSFANIQKISYAFYIMKTPNHKYKNGTF